jgi:hypothetical protein
MFQAVPEQYDLRRALADLGEDVWLARQRAHDMAPGQEVFFWLARKGGGLVAVGRLISPVEEQAAPAWQLPYWMPAARAAAATVEPRIRVRYTSKFPGRPLSRDLLRMDPALGSQQPIGPVYVGTNFAVTEAARLALLARIAGR